MSDPSLVLFISENSANVQAVREMLSSGDDGFTVQHVERLRTALARIAGGGVAVVLLDISLATEAQRQETLAALHEGTPELPVIGLSESESEEESSVAHEGLPSCIARPNWQRDLKRSVSAAIMRQQVRSGRLDRTGEGRGTVVAVLGAKGGVGTSTVALNIASVLAADSRVILAELRPSFGTLCHVFRPHRAVRTLENVLHTSPAEIDIRDMEACLWANRSLSGLSVLFAPEKASNHVELNSDRVAETIRSLTMLGDMIVVDLPASLSEANQAALRMADTLAFVVERDALSVDAGKSKLTVLESLGIIPQEAGLVIVNRVPLATPPALAEIESQLDLSAYAVIPPAADLCAAAYRVHIPVAKLDPQSSIATSLISLARRVSGRS